MRVAVPISDGRISPVFDVARRLLLVDVEGGNEAGRIAEALQDCGLPLRARRVADLSVDVLICGAISRPLEEMLLSAGVEVVPRRCGPVEDVLAAFLSGQLTEQAFVMPGSRASRQFVRRGGVGKGR